MKCSSCRNELEFNKDFEMVYESKINEEYHVYNKELSYRQHYIRECGYDYNLLYFCKDCKKRYDNLYSLGFIIQLSIIVILPIILIIGFLLLKLLK